MADDEPALVVPFSETDPHTTPLFPDGPANLVREQLPWDLEDGPEIACDFRRRRPRAKS
jgi:hypothetical protein